MVQARGQEWTDADGEIHARRWKVSIAEDQDTMSTRQQRFYWGVVLKQIAAQAPGGWTPEAWHGAFKRTTLGYEVTQEPVAGRKRSVTIRRLRSITKLTVKQMSDYLDQVIATATTDLGVVFEFDAEREAVRYQPPKRRKQERTAELAAAGVSD
jgi:hypothetical protein